MTETTPCPITGYDVPKPEAELLAQLKTIRNALGWLGCADERHGIGEAMDADYDRAVEALESIEAAILATTQTDH